MRSPSLALLALFFAGSTQARPSQSAPPVAPLIFQGKEIKNLLAFGDSYTYVQGTQGHWNYSFISDAFNYSYTPEQLLSSEIVKNTTSSGGPNWVDLPLHHNYTVPLVDQVKQWDLINDINDSAKFTNVSFAAWNFLFMLPPPLEKTASNLVSSNPLPNAAMMGQWNAAVQAQASAFQARHNDSRTAVFDTYAFLNGVLADAARYGIYNTTSYCQSYAQADILWNYAGYGCQPISEYFWFNSGHITFTVHEIIADEVLRQLA
ncbi:putative lysophospholipase a protein [Neofusicoccum parvum UCRNP2]|uniref:Putative lysophospholipase a protein n=1 Tax=Botryosphaeria parva (strain UCR-NP2) TaxID=1287680 RepID=R1GZB5_BOTPV|nr:putative lysophospholipase a protein [Neofusicoccum parvum UCRNP2]